MQEVAFETLGATVAKWLVGHADRLEASAKSAEVDTKDADALAAHVQLLREPARLAELARAVSELDDKTIIGDLRKARQSLWSWPR